MKNYYFLLLAILIIQGCSKNHLESCWKKQVAPLQTKGLAFTFEKKLQGFSHSMEPWEKYSLVYKGHVWLDSDRFRKSDTVFGRSNLTSMLELSKDTLLIMGYRDTVLQETSTTADWNRRFVQTLTYSPVLLIDHFYKENIPLSSDADSNFWVYSMVKDMTNISLYIDKKDTLLKKVTVLSNDEKDDQFYGLGDVLNTYHYEHYTQLAELYHPEKIKIEKLNGRLLDSISLTSLMNKAPIKLLNTPKNYSLVTPEPVEENLSIERFSENIYFINMHHLGTRSLMVEFENYVLVAESALNSKNGESLMREAQRIVNDKPIKYFVYGHFHPHYTGGIRPFIHTGAKIICKKEDKEYIEHLANTKHTLDPDQLEKEPKTVLFDFIEDEKIITDGNFEMKIIHIGEKSNHTKDYLIYYFPKEKMVFQDDLVWINEHSTRENLSKMTIGFYHAIKELGIQVETVVQNWGVFDKEDKMVFKFEDIETIMTKGSLH